MNLTAAAVPVAVFGLPAALGLLLPGLLANGQYGAGWNRVGLDQYLGVPGQGVSGIWVPAGLTSDWPGQLFAQLIGLLAIVVWSFGPWYVLLRAYRAVVGGWSARELNADPSPRALPHDDNLAPAAAMVAHGDGPSQRANGVSAEHEAGGLER